MTATATGPRSSDDREAPTAHARELARAAAQDAIRKKARSRVYRRGGYIMIALLLIVTLLSVIYIVTNRHNEDLANSGLQFVIPNGASETVAIPTINSAIAIPTSIVFKPGEPAVLSIRNEDSVANRAGPWVVGPGQTYTAKFDKPGVYKYVCSVNAAESVTITVEGDDS
ncbi:MAG TPA: plastocyanin/azurin family copper-binding protein [Thermomicrobiales bacterium]|nr:plastocyanin/azurin family copper-binding protein [Thermomicrobiales bacterium]